MTGLASLNTRWANITVFLASLSRISPTRVLTHLINDVAYLIRRLLCSYWYIETIWAQLITDLVSLTTELAAAWGRGRRAHQFFPKSHHGLVELHQRLVESHRPIFLQTL